MPNSDSVAYHREVSLLIDAFDAFPQRVDLAFDSTWRAFEAGLHDLRDAGDQNTTVALAAYARGLGQGEPGAMSSAIESLPQQALEFLVTRWIDGPVEGSKLSRRLANGGANQEGPAEIRDLLRAQYNLGELHDRRKAARLLLLAMRGQAVTISSRRVTLSSADRVLVLV